MELSGLIFVALALVWAVVLLPKALKHHDDLAEPESTDGASDRPRVLARREAVTSRSSRLVVTSEEPAPVEQLEASPRPISARAHRAAAAAAARRRRRVLLVLLVITAATGAAAFAGPVPAWVPAVPAAMVVAFLVVARITVRQEHARWEALRAARREGRRLVSPAVEPHAETEADVVAVRAEPSPAAAAAATEAAAAPAFAPAAKELSLDDTQAIRVEQLAQARAAVQAEVLAEAVPTTDSATLWDPLPVTLPTYVGKPRATRSVRTIDLTAADVASAGRDAAASALVAEAATAAEPEGPGQRAVGS